MKVYYLDSIIFIPFVCFLLFNSYYKKGDYITPNKKFAADSITTTNVSYDNYIHDLLKKIVQPVMGQEVRQKPGG